MCANPTHHRTEHGLVTVELALVLFTFLLLMLGTLEVARVMYVLNTVQDVTRVAARAAAVTDFSSGTQMAALRRQALFRSDDGPLPLLPELGPAQLQIEYLGQDTNGNIINITRPACPAANVVNCTREPHGNSCIRLVRVSICSAMAADGTCTALRYRPMTGIVAGFDAMALPPSATVVKAESLGYVPDQPNCL